MNKMSSKRTAKPKARKLKNGLVPDDRKLWDHVASTIEPVSLKRRVIEQPLRQTANEKIEPRKPVTRAPAKPEATKKTRRSHNFQTKKVSASVSTLDRRQTRKLAKGQKEINGRIDLHGMRQWEAHAALHEFLARSSAVGHRTVLVITGKGKREAVTLEQDILSEPREHGVLRRIVPEWLASDPQISPLVTGIASAGPRHGGEGALYVTLRAVKLRNT